MTDQRKVGVGQRNGRACGVAEHVRIISAIEPSRKLDCYCGICIHNAAIVVTQLGCTRARGGRLRHEADLRTLEDYRPFEHDMRWSAGRN